MKVSFSPKAARDLREIGDFIFEDNPSAARRFVGQLRERCNLLAVTPKGGRPRPELGSEIRSVSFEAYVIFYVCKPQEVRIERVIHGARDIEAVLSSKA